MGLCFSTLQIKTAHHVTRFVEAVHIEIKQTNAKRIDDRHLSRFQCHSSSSGVVYNLHWTCWVVRQRSDDRCFSLLVVADK
jgi:hypothetical protein